MTDWNRRGEGNRSGRDEGWPRSGREPRSFDFESDWVDPARGGYSGEGSDRPDVRGGPYPRPEDADAREGFDRYGVRGEKDYRGETYRARDLEEARRDAPGSDDRGGVVGVNPPLDRVAEDAAPRGWRETVGRGEGRHRGRGPKNYVRSDARIREDVSERLSEDSWLDASDIEVEVQSGEVTLAGVARTRDDRRRAEDIAWQAGGVKHVQNDLRVRPAAATPHQGRPA